jgi:hypothetical protein
VPSGDREGVDLDEVAGLGEGGYPHDDIGGLVVAEQGMPRLLDDREEVVEEAADVC